MLKTIGEITSSLFYRSAGSSLKHRTLSCERKISRFSGDIIIGGTEENVDSENAGPVIKMYMDSTIFIPGGRTSKSPVLLASLTDTNGINCVGLGIGHEITTVMDGNSAYPTVLDDYFTPDLDKFQSGTIRYQLLNLANGFHKISLKAWDFYNNSSEKEISFFVMDQPGLSMQEVFNFPNPLRDNMYTTFQFTPMQNAGILDIRILIASLTGTIVKTIETKISEYGTGPVFIHWDGRGDNGNRLSSGMYLYTLFIKGENGVSAKASQKLVIMN